MSLDEWLLCNQKLIRCQWSACCCLPLKIFFEQKNKENNLFPKNLGRTREPSVQMNIRLTLHSDLPYDASQCKSIFYGISLKLPCLSLQGQPLSKILSFPCWCEQHILPSTPCNLMMEMYSSFQADMEHRTGHISLLIQQPLIIMGGWKN